MQDFEFLAGFFGILLGLIIAEVAGKLAEAIDNRHEHPIGVLTPLLATVVLGDVTGFWLWIWAQRDTLTVSWRSVFACTAMGIVYYLAVALVFPRSRERWRDLDGHYWARKRWVLGGILMVDVTLMASQLTRALPRLDDGWFFFYQGIYFVPLVALLFTRRRGLDIALLSCLLVSYAIAAFDVLPPSQWGNQVDLNPGRAAPLESPKT